MRPSSCVASKWSALSLQGSSGAATSGVPTPGPCSSSRGSPAAAAAALNRESSSSSSSSSGTLLRARRSLLESVRDGTDSDRSMGSQRWASLSSCASSSWASLTSSSPSSPSSSPSPSPKSKPSVEAEKVALDTGATEPSSSSLPSMDGSADGSKLRRCLEAILRLLSPRP